jgi:hypothetical protein
MQACCGSRPGETGKREGSGASDDGSSTSDSAPLLKRKKKTPPVTPPPPLVRTAATRTHAAAISVCNAPPANLVILGGTQGFCRFALRRPSQR